MNKRIKALLMALVMMLSTVGMAFSNIQSAMADDGFTVRFHYLRTDDNYTDWSLWVWGGGDGAAFNFTGKDENGVYCDYKANSGDTKLGFIVRKGEWEAKDPDGDRYVDVSDVISGTVDVYCKTGVFAVDVNKDNAVKGAKVCAAKVELADMKKISVELSIEPDAAVTAERFQVKEAGTTNTIEIAEIVQDAKDVKKYDIILATELEKTIQYDLFFDGNQFGIKMPEYYSSQEFEDEYYYDGNDLGATWTKASTTFKVWAPTATAVSVRLYEKGEAGTGDSPLAEVPMTKGEKGVWSATRTGDLNGTYYTYAVTFQNGKTNEANDPYAVTTGVNGDRAMVIDLASTNPEGWDKDTNPNKGLSYTDAVIYELHVRDFSYDAESGMKNTGKYLAFTEEGTKNSAGKTTGIDYIKELGVTHVHLLPSYDYATVDETKLTTKDQFNWGYDPKNYNVPEGSYSTDPYNGEVRVKEFKQMVQSMHNNGISVIMDVVYNHTYSSDNYCFNQIVPGYFHRPGSNASGCGNDVASERAMVSKYIVDSVLYWHNEYHIDGFRFDLSGLIDTDTINKLTDELHKLDPSIILYGEGWSMSSTVLTKDVKLACQSNADMTPGFAYFSDSMRDSVKGGVFDDLEAGYVTRNFDKTGVFLDCLKGVVMWADGPSQLINYNSCHDNYSLFDKIQITNKKTDGYANNTKQNMLAAAANYLSQGIPFMQAGEEILRTKEISEGVYDHNSYASPSSLNSIKWGTLSDATTAKVLNYYKGLIEFRKNHAGLRLQTRLETMDYVKTYLKGSPTEKGVENVVAITISGNATNEISDGIVAIFNPNKEAKTVTLPAGAWKICVQGDKAGTKVLGTARGSIKVAGISATILVKGATKLTDKVVHATSVKASTSKVTLGVGMKTTLKATAAPSNCTDEVLWTSANPSIATVTETGVVTAKKAGTVKLTATATNGKSATVTVTVKKAPTSIKLNKSSLTINVGKATTLKTTITAGSFTKVTYTSSNSKVVKVSAAGRITAVKAGTATITAKTANGKKATCKVTVKIAPTSIKLNKSSATLKVGKTLKLSYTITKNSYTTVTYTTSNKSVATVAKDGKVTAKKAGTATITAKTANGKKATCKITVKKK